VPLNKATALAELDRLVAELIRDVLDFTVMDRA
jgi:hypothetical protein